MSFVRNSKFRHVFGKPNKNADCFNGVKMSGQGDRNVDANSVYIAVIRDQKILLLPADKPGRYEDTQIAYIDSKSKVWDVEFSPFDDSILAAGTELGDINVYILPETLPDPEDPIKEPFWQLQGRHYKKVQYLVWHPSAENILASVGADPWIILWNVEAQEPICQFDFPDVPYDLCWNSLGDQFAVVYNNKNKTGLRVLDARSGEVKAENCTVHEGTKSPKVVFLSNNNIITIGSNKQAQKSLKMWKGDDYHQCVCELDLSSSSGVLNSYYDPDLSIIYTYVKGDSSVKFFEIVDEEIFYLSAYSSPTSCRGGNFIAKRNMNPKIHEIARFIKLEDKRVEPVSLMVPRKSDNFQGDLYPDCCSAEPALTAEEWVSGKNAEPKRMKISFEGTEAQTVKRAPKKIVRPPKTESSHDSPQSNQNNYATVPETSKEYLELLEDMKKVKATVRKLNKRVTKLEEMQEQVQSLQNEEEEEEEE